MLILITGGAGSGKSAFAENLAMQLQKLKKSGNLYYFATMQVREDDPECQKRIRKHQKQRAGKNFITIETPFLEIPDFSENSVNSWQSGTGLLECMSNLLANLQFDFNNSENQALPKRITGKILQLSACLENLVVITNEIFRERIPADSAMRDYLRNLGEVNCSLAEHAEIVIEIQAGIPIIWKGENFFHEVMG
ncbi:MAG: bifunctional adenosylcobinamide kinase/adenosylcobinamide-phosphate guanylyltransferase [Oscillospiraceae bacterium]|nr:bifunctional adenosylcobinamide kinase/adenosylcobinamide-phosphate guanylyltransferase [Oscillospiraceae bacterium]